MVLHHCNKRIRTKNQKVFGAKLWVVEVTGEVTVVEVTPYPERDKGYFDS